MASRIRIYRMKIISVTIYSNARAFEFTDFYTALNCTIYSGRKIQKLYGERNT